MYPIIENDKNKLSKIAAIQMCSSHHIDENLENAGKFIREAASQDAQLVVLPENFAFMGLNNADRFVHKEEMGHGKIQTFLSNQANANHLWIVGGTIPIACDHPQKVRAACLVYDEKGSMVARYDKIHLFDAIVSNKEEHKESSVVEPGNQIIVIDTPVGKLGLAVCFDVRFPSLFTKLVELGVEIIALPSAFTVPTGEAHWQTLTRCRAIDTFSYLIAPGQGGLHTNGRETFGHSVVIDPWGIILAEKADSTPGIIYAEIDLNRVYQCRKSIPLHPSPL